jgi:hypothetical protein
MGLHIWFEIIKKLIMKISLLGCDHIWSGRNLATFRKKLLQIPEDSNSEFCGSDSIKGEEVFELLSNFWLGKEECVALPSLLRVTQSL